MDLYEMREYGGMNERFLALTCFLVRSGIKMSLIKYKFGEWGLRVTSPKSNLRLSLVVAEGHTQKTDICMAMLFRGTDHLFLHKWNEIGLEFIAEEETAESFECCLKGLIDIVKDFIATGGVDWSND